jgi:hypothetical protein
MGGKYTATISVLMLRWTERACPKGCFAKRPGGRWMEAKPKIKKLGSTPYGTENLKIVNFCKTFLTAYGKYLLIKRKGKHRGLPLQAWPCFINGYEAWWKAVSGW